MLEDPISHALRVRSGPHSDTRATSAMRFGLQPETEYHAYAEVLPRVPDPRDPDAYLKAAALVTLHPKITQAPRGSHLPLGASLSQMSMALARKNGSATPWIKDPSRPDAIASRLSQLPELDLQGVADSLNRIFSLADDLGVSVDFYALAALFSRWGNGLSAESTYVRRGLLRDYYGHSNNSNNDNDKDDK